MSAGFAGGWTEEALCAQTDPEIFHPERGESSTAAKAVCRSCPVRQACEEAVFSIPSSQDRYGILAGYSERERRKIRAQRAATPPTPRGEVAA